LDRFSSSFVFRFAQTFKIYPSIGEGLFTFYSHSIVNQYNHGSILDPSLSLPRKTDITLAEGLLNIIGFENGMQKLIRYTKANGYLIIHDELKHDRKKRTFFEKEHLKLLGSFQLNPDVWWNDYYACLENQSG